MCSCGLFFCFYFWFFSFFWNSNAVRRVLDIVAFLSLVKSIFMECVQNYFVNSLKIVVLRKQCKILTNIWTCVTLKWLFRRISRFSWNRIFSLIEDSLLPRKSLYSERSLYALWEERETRIKLCFLSLLLKGTANCSFSLIRPKFCFVFSQWRI